MRKKRNILYKFIILVILIIVIFKTNDVNYEKLPSNTYYNNIVEAQEMYRLNNVKSFIAMIENEEYDKAYVLLTEECKNNDYDSVMKFQNFCKTYFIDNSKAEKRVNYEIIQENGSSKNIRVRFSIKNIEDYKKMSNTEEDNKYYRKNILDIKIEEKSINDYKYNISLYE